MMLLESIGGCFSSCKNYIAPCMKTEGENVICCEVTWTKEQCRILTCCIVIILIISLITGDFLKMGGLIGCGIVGAIFLNRGLNKCFTWLKSAISSVSQRSQNQPPPPPPSAVVASVSVVPAEPARKPSPDPAAEFEKV